MVILMCAHLILRMARTFRQLRYCKIYLSVQCRWPEPSAGSSVACFNGNFADFATAFGPSSTTTTDDITAMAVPLPIRPPPMDEDRNCAGGDTPPPRHINNWLDFDSLESISPRPSPPTVQVQADVHIPPSAPMSDASIASIRPTRSTNDPLKGDGGWTSIMKNNPCVVLQVFVISWKSSYSSMEFK